MENYNFWSEIGSGFGESGGIDTRNKNSQEYPPPRAFYALGKIGSVSLWTLALLLSLIVNYFNEFLSRNVHSMYCVEEV